MKHLILALMLSFTACTKVCSLEDTFVASASQGIAKALQCQNVDAIAVSVRAAADKLNICPKQPTMTLSLPVVFCAPMADILVSSLAGNTIPSAWGCSAQSAQDQLKALIVKACSGS